MTTLAAISIALLCGCSAERNAIRYLNDAPFRRAQLEASLPERGNRYASLRLASYATWQELDEWNPRTEPVAAAELDRSESIGDRPLSSQAQALPISSRARAGSEEELRALGAAAFFRYPVQLEPLASRALSSRTAAARYGIWTDPERGAGGLLRVELGDGSTALALTCATCHARVSDGTIIIGAANDALDLGRLIADAASANGRDPGLAATWGPGRLDVTTTDGKVAVRIPDLRPIRLQTHLHFEATVEQKNVVSLALRIETLIITSHGEALRPPREVALGLALYLWSLSPARSDRPKTGKAILRGQKLFAEQCARCHGSAGRPGQPVAWQVVGTDGVAARSKERGTGRYRVPSLEGVSSRGALMHDGSVGSLDALLDPSRRSGTPPGESAIGGHAFGLQLDDSARSDLLAFLKTQ